MTFAKTDYDCSGNPAGVNLLDTQPVYDLFGHEICPGLTVRLIPPEQASSLDDDLDMREMDIE